jgi:hypothetical protein
MLNKLCLYSERIVSVLPVIGGLASFYLLDHRLYQPSGYNSKDVGLFVAPQICCSQKAETANARDYTKPQSLAIVSQNSSFAGGLGTSSYLKFVIQTMSAYTDIKHRSFGHVLSLFYESIRIISTCADAYPDDHLEFPPLACISVLFQERKWSTSGLVRSLTIAASPLYGFA